MYSFIFLIYSGALLELLMLLDCAAKVLACLSVRPLSKGLYIIYFMKFTL